MSCDMVTEYVFIGISGERYHPLYRRRNGLWVWVLANVEQPDISLPGYYTTEQIARMCNIDDEELIFIKLKYCT